MRLQCGGDESVDLRVTWSVSLSDLPVSDLPDLHDIGEQRHHEPVALMNEGGLM